MARSKTPSFITEVPLVVNSQQEKELLARFQSSRQLYNALLNEAMAHITLVRNSDIYLSAKKLSKGNVRDKSFSEARKAYQYKEQALP